MAIETFTWKALAPADANVKLRNRKAQFGDGYAQVAGDGLNSREQSWNLSFGGTEAEISAIVAFLDRMAGRRAFQWKPPLYPLGLWTCEEYAPKENPGNYFTLTATFEQAFRP